MGRSLGKLTRGTNLRVGFLALLARMAKPRSASGLAASC